MKPVYLDCNATTPIDPIVRDVFLQYLNEEFGNEGSRTHEYGVKAKQAVQKARDQISALVDAERDEVIFTSGATESNNLAILGLRSEAIAQNRKHFITTEIEHKAVLEPFEQLSKNGVEVSYLPVNRRGLIDLSRLADTLRPDTFLVSIMHVNNETGILQPLDEVVSMMAEHPAFLHTDAAQGYGKEISMLRSKRIDLISISGHKLFAPKGVGALVARKRGYDRPPLEPLMFGGGQERGLRPGTLPVALIAALGEASSLASENLTNRQKYCAGIRQAALSALGRLDPVYTGDQDLVLNHVLNVSFPGFDSEALIVALKDLVAISNGSACTSTKYKPSHVLKAMGMNDDEANGFVRISWSHLTPKIDWERIVNRIESFK